MEDRGSDAVIEKSMIENRKSPILIAPAYCITDSGETPGPWVWPGPAVAAVAALCTMSQ